MCGVRRDPWRTISQQLSNFTFPLAKKGKLFNFDNSSRCILTWISLKNNDTEYFSFSCLLSIHMSLFAMCMFKNCFYWVTSYFSVLRVLCILLIYIFSDMCIANIFLSLCGLHFHGLRGTFWRIKFYLGEM